MGVRCVGILAALSLLDVRVCRAAVGTDSLTWETVVGVGVGTVVAGAAVVLALQIQRLLRALPSPVMTDEIVGEPFAVLPCRSEEPSATECDGHPGSRRFGLQYSQFELFKRMHGDLEPATLAAAVLEYVGEYYGGSVGVLYLPRPDDSLEPAATFGLAPGATPPRTVIRGTGIVGRAAERRQVVVLNQVDERHLDLATGLGQSPPRSVIVATFHFAGQVKGALEMAVAGSVADEDLDFLRASSESVAMALDSALARLRERRLLKETRRQAEVLAEQRQQLQQKNAELEQADRYKNEFLANMSHELRTPLNSMLIISQILAENDSGNLASVEVDNALTINQAGNELLLIINDILDMSRVEAGRLEVHPESTDLRQVLRGLEDLFRPAAERKGLTLRATWEAGAPRSVVTDPLRLSQILKNLLNNAFKFTGEGEVHLCLRRADTVRLDHPPDDAANWVAFTVGDTGIGMDTETVERVFGAFQQGDGSIARRYGGSGLGLSISRSLAELLGGEIQVTSRAGQGSEFTLLLPQGESATAEVVEDAGNPGCKATGDVETCEPETAVHDCDGSLADRRVLLVDTDMRTVYELSSALDGAGAEVGVTRSAAAAGERLSTRGPWDFLVVDGELLAAADELAAAADAGDTCVIVLDGIDADPGASPERPHLTKPVGQSEFIRLCRTISRKPVTAGPGAAHRPEVGMPS
ncbi:MAG: GAF domain-containing protein [bacterium]|nr:GAF domain-containing protein [bacterium]